MADTYTYAGGYRAKVVITTLSTDSTAVMTTARLDGFTVVADSPAEQIAAITSSLGDAGSAGIISYSGTFNARLLNKNFSTRGHAFLLGSSNTAVPTLIEFYTSSKDKYDGPVVLTNLSIDGAGAAVVKFSGSWVGCDSFEYSTI